MAAFHLGHSDVGNHVWEIHIAICHDGDASRVQQNCTRVDGHVVRWGWEQGVIWIAVGLYGWEKSRLMVVCVSERHRRSGNTGTGCVARSAQSTIPVRCPRADGSGCRRQRGNDVEQPVQPAVFGHLRHHLWPYLLRIRTNLVQVTHTRQQVRTIFVGERAGGTKDRRHLA